MLRLRQILVNLLSNAVKFTPEGGEAGAGGRRARAGGGHGALYGLGHAGSGSRRRTCRCCSSPLCSSTAGWPASTPARGWAWRWSRGSRRPTAGAWPSRARRARAAASASPCPGARAFPRPRRCRPRLPSTRRAPPSARPWSLRTRPPRPRRSRATCASWARGSRSTRTQPAPSSGRSRSSPM